MFRYGTLRINRVVQDLANFMISFMLGKELLPVLDALHVYLTD
jgi:hypothetical protein